MIQDHYLTDDLDQVTVHLDIMHKSLMNMLEGATKADFKLAEQSQIQLHKSLLMMIALNSKKLNRSEHELNDREFMRRYYW